MLISPQHLDELASRLGGMAPGRLRTATVSWDGDPLLLVRAGAASYAAAGYFGVPGRTEMGALGVAWRAVASGPTRLRALSDEIESAGIAAGTRLLVGFSFADDGPRRPEWDGFPAAGALLPQVAAFRDGDGGRLIVSVPPGASAAEVLASLAGLAVPDPPSVPEAASHVIDAYPSPAVWREEVAEAIGAIRSGSLRKVVLARSVEIRSDPIADPFGLVEQLRSRQPESFAYGWQERDAVFIGASPELLARREGSDVESHPHAGSAGRGDSGDDDRRLGLALLRSGKDQNEHRLVVDDVVRRLGPLTTGLNYPGEPSLRKTATVQHLATRVTGTLGSGASLLQIAEALHPTPAVGGTPRREALAFIDKAEGLDRGWYSGGIGWTTPDGDGEIAIAVRCGLLRGDTAHLFAGNGIVAGSDPDAELAETRLKFRPLMNLLAAT